MNKIKIAINGFGRIGRAAFRSIYQEGIDIQVVAINDLAELATLSHSLKYDSVYGLFEKEVALRGASLLIDGKEIPVFCERDPEKLPWEKLGIDVVLECTGAFCQKDAAQKHIRAGAKLVVISANAKGSDVSHFVLGMNEKDFDPKKHQVSAMCSCTTNCAVPVIHVLNEAFGLLKAHMLTIHAVTANQNLVDGPHKDLRRGRSALVNSVPTTTGSDKAVVKVLPELEGRISASAVRVPVLCGSLLEIVANLKQEVSADEINDVFQSASQGNLNGTLSVTMDPLVSSDIIGTTEGAIVDLPSTEALDLPEIKDENLVKVIAWYDNEYAYGYRLAKFAQYIGEKLK